MVGAGGVAQVSACLVSIEALGSNPSTAPKNKKKVPQKTCGKRA